MHEDGTVRAVDEMVRRRSDPVQNAMISPEPAALAPHLEDLFERPWAPGCSVLVCAGRSPFDLSRAAGCRGRFPASSVRAGCSRYPSFWSRTSGRSPDCRFPSRCLIAGRAPGSCSSCSSTASTVLHLQPPALLLGIGLRNGFLQGAALTLFICSSRSPLDHARAQRPWPAVRNGVAFGVSTFYASFFRGTPLLSRSFWSISACRSSASCSAPSRPVIAVAVLRRVHGRDLPRRHPGGPAGPAEAAWRLACASP